MKRRAERGILGGIEFARLFDMSGDSGLFRTSRQLVDEGFVRSGGDFLKDSGAQYMPLYEAKMVHQFDHRWATYNDGSKPSRDVTIAEKSDPSFEPIPHYWVPLEEVNRRLAAKNWQYHWLIGWRDICRSTDMRTVISGVIPLSGCSDKFLLMLTKAGARYSAALLAIMCSLVFDFVARQKLGGTSLKYFVMKQLVAPRPSEITESNLAFIVPRVLQLAYTSNSMRPFAEDLDYQGPPFPWNEDLRARLRAELDAYIARLYGISRNQLRFVLDPTEVYGPDYPSETFRVLKKNEMKAHGEYRTQRLVLDAWDRLERGEIAEISPPITVETRPATAAQPPVSIDPAILFDSAWARPIAGTQDVRAATLAQLAALIKALTGPTPIEKVRRAALYALEPRYLTRRLSGVDRATWLRLVGSDAVVASGTNIAAFSPAIDAGWRDAVTQLRGMGAIIEDAAADTWAPGARLDEFYTETWPDGRASFVLKALESMTQEEKEADLSVEDQQWVRADAG